MTGFDRSGVISIVAVWVLVVLVLIAAGLGRRAAVDLALARYTIGQARARIAAVSGVYRALAAVKPAKSDTDVDLTCRTLYRCGFALAQGETAEDIFGRKELGTAVSEVYHVLGSGRDVLEQPGPEDEAGRINLNALSALNFMVLRELLIVLGESSVDAAGIASSVVDWIDSDDEKFNDDGAERDYYAAQNPPYLCKNAQFESPEELMLVRGMTPQIFARLEPYITVLPRGGGLRINWNTASNEVLLALARSVPTARSQTAEALVKKMTDFRAGSDDQWGTADDEELDPATAGARFPRAADEEAIWASLSAGQIYTVEAPLLRFFSRGTDTASGVQATYEVTLDRRLGIIAGWTGRDR